MNAWGALQPRGYNFLPFRPVGPRSHSLKLLHLLTLQSSKTEAKCFTRKHNLRIGHTKHLFYDQLQWQGTTQIADSLDFVCLENKCCNGADYGHTSTTKRLSGACLASPMNHPVVPLRVTLHRGPRWSYTCGSISLCAQNTTQKRAMRARVGRLPREVQLWDKICKPAQTKSHFSR
jgi:hypothetical protein